MKAKYRLTRIDGAAKYLHDAARRFLAKVEQHVEFSKAVRIVITPGERLECPDGTQPFGAFAWKDNPRVAPVIYMTGKIAWMFSQAPKSEAIDCWLFTLAHELAHYEQWRDGRKMTERGVDVRARHLMELCGY